MSIDFHRLQILLVDDNQYMRNLIRQILHGFGLTNVVECSDGSDALSVLRSTPCDLIISDWMMDPLDGLEMTRILRTAQDSPHPLIPIIMLTGHTERHRVEEARDAGVTEFLAKPVTPKGVYSRLQAVVENPRSFIKQRRFSGPDRRRKLEDFAGESRRWVDQDTRKQPA